jgi:hypothetical protein
MKASNVGILTIVVVLVLAAFTATKDFSPPVAPPQDVCEIACCPEKPEALVCVQPEETCDCPYHRGL